MPVPKTPEDFQKQIDVGQPRFEAMLAGLFAGLQNEVDLASWRTALQFLLGDDRLWQVIENRYGPKYAKKPGRPTEHSARRLKALAKRFERYRREKSKGYSRLRSRKEVIKMKSFRKDFASIYRWLPPSNDTVENLIIQGNRLLKQERQAKVFSEFGRRALLAVSAPK